MLQLRCNNKEEMNLDSSAAKGTRMPSRAPFFTDGELCSPRAREEIRSRAGADAGRAKQKGRLRMQAALWSKKFDAD
jgi:hypothetical protein